MDYYKKGINLRPKVFNGLAYIGMGEIQRFDVQRKSLFKKVDYI